MGYDFKYQSGFGNYFETEALPGTLPKGQNSPQRPAHGLYAEQLSGTAFTAPRAENLRTWFYRIRPSVLHGAFQLSPNSDWQTAPFHDAPPPTPQQLRWDPPPNVAKPTPFLAGVHTVAGNGDALARAGGGIHVYCFNQSMGETFFNNADGEMLFVPQLGRLVFRTEMGPLLASPGEVALIPRGVKFQVESPDALARGYFCENYGQPFRLPYLGPIGANGSANVRDFLAPTAQFEDKEGHFRLVTKFSGHFWEASLDHHPLDVVAWHGNYTPYLYDLKRFQACGSISFDHPDPSIWTVLTSPSELPGTANFDFVIFPERWLVAEHTFRPPYYHRNSMSEFMGLVEGVYDAKLKGCDPGGYSLHNCMSAHGPDSMAFEKASGAKLEPQFLGKTLAFMFESYRVLVPTAAAMSAENFQKDYLSCWGALKSHFDPKGGKNG